VLRFPLIQLGEVLLAVAQLKVSVDRLGNFLGRADETSSSSGPSRMEPARAEAVAVATVKEEEEKEPAQQQQQPVIELTECSFHWDVAADAAPVLSGVTLSVRDAVLTVVLGRVGCGKSSLLLSLLGETWHSAGTMRMVRPPGDADTATVVAPVLTQECWLLSGTLRANILFGAKFDEAAYRAVVVACCLVPDFAAIPDGDQAFVGEKGVTLSGGQKARVALARVCYRCTTDSAVSLVRPAAVHSYASRDLPVAPECGVWRVECGSTSL
jgi:ATP-binding cassette subfamily C (CFTR/MRP) protein 1